MKFYRKLYPLKFIHNKYFIINLYCYVFSLIYYKLKTKLRANVIKSLEMSIKSWTSEMIRLIHACKDGNCNIQTNKNKKFYKENNLSIE